MKYQPLIKALFIVLLITWPGIFAISAVLGRGVYGSVAGIIIYFVLGLILGLIEFYVVRCPKCKRKPIAYKGKFPSNCQYCGETLIPHTNDIA